MFENKILKKKSQELNAKNSLADIKLLVEKNASKSEIAGEVSAPS